MKSKGNITLFYPSTFNVGIAKALNFPLRFPLSLITIAPYLRDSFNVRIIDSRIHDYRDYDFTEDFCVGITCKTGSEIRLALEFAEYIKARYPHIVVVVGGSHTTILPEQTLANRNIDIIVRGEGEFTFRELTECLHTGGNLRDVKGIAYKENGEVVFTDQRPLMNLDDCLMPAYDLLELEKYFLYREGFDYESSRGCPFRCGFCYNNTMGGKWRSWRGKSAEKVLKEIKYIKETFAINTLNINDDLFFASRKRAEAILDGMLEDKLDIQWSSSCETVIFSKLSDSFLSKLAKSGCKMIFFGAESGSVDVLRRINKRISPEHTFQSIVRCNQYGIHPVMNFIVGFPQESFEEIKCTLDFIDKIRKEYPNASVSAVSIYVHMPGTRLFNRAVDEGLKAPRTLEEWEEWQFDDNILEKWTPPRKYAEEIRGIYLLSRYLYIYNKTSDRLRTRKLRYFAFRLLNAPLYWSYQYRWKHRKFKYAWEFRLFSSLVRLFFSDII